jgi:fructose/tagatose bisphosphate aldolase
VNARFTAHFTREITPGVSRSRRTFKGTITVKEEGDHFVAAVIGTLHGILKEENLTGVSKLQLSVSIIKPRRK